LGFLELFLGLSSLNTTFHRLNRMFNVAFLYRAFEIKSAPSVLNPLKPMLRTISKLTLTPASAPAESEPASNRPRWPWARFWRWGRLRLAPWITLLTAGWNRISAWGDQDHHERSRWLVALSRINFVAVYGLLSELLW
jgi:hypothetical protein